MGYVRNKGTKSSATKKKQKCKADLEASEADAAVTQGKRALSHVLQLRRQNFCPGRRNCATARSNLHQLLQAAALLGGEEGRVQVTPVALVIVVLVVRADSRL